MQRQILMTALLAGLALPAAGAWADAKQDLCHAKAKKDSGYRSWTSKAASPEGGVQMRLSGSAGFGVSHSSGAASNTPTAPFAGSAATERRARETEEKYQRLYDACINNQ